ncbi:MAG: amphi-Trp domain-containing protein [Desulfomonile tiedjei]|nr:amphi-Trp domain-containing protein [Desulfomonile tiedjei]
MGEDKGFKPTENIGREGRDEGSDELTNRKVEHESRLDFQMAVDYLQQVLETARSGNLLVEADGKSVNLAPTGGVDLEIKAKDKHGRQSLAFELTWENKPEAATQAEEVVGGDIRGDVCVANRVSSMEQEAGDYDDLERRFEQELFGGCGCVAIPGS